MTTTDLHALDAAVRIEVLDVNRSFIVQAPAGSGKTELLVQRYLALLATVRAPEEIVAVTFTRKAAAEMRGRVLRALEQTRDKPPELEHARRTYELAHAALKRDEQLQWRLAKNPSRFRILTIDALNGWLARQLPWRARIGAFPVVADDALEIHTEAVRETLLGKGLAPETRASLTRLLVHLDNRFDGIQRRLADMLAVRDQWSRIVSDELAARNLLETMLRDSIEARLGRLIAAIPPRVAEAVPALAAHSAKVLLHEKQSVTSEAISVCSDMHALPEGTMVEIPKWKGLAALMLTADGNVRKPNGVNRAIGFLPKSSEKAQFQKLLEEIADQEHFASLLHVVRVLPEKGYTDDQWSILGVIVQVLHACMNNLQEIFAKRAIVDHTQMAAAALDALGEDLLPSDLALMLEYRIQHLLVDEFQDTSASQYALLGRLTAGWSDGDGHTLFLVGDPMQSIYRFREAEVSLFLRACHVGRLASVRLHSRHLHVNFRSTSTIIGWVNAVFSKIMPHEDDVETAAVRYTPAVVPESAETASEGVEFRLYVGADRDAEAEYVAEAAAKAVEEGNDEHSVAILVRARRHLLPIAAALKKHAISFRAVEVEQLGETPVVRDLLALTTALLHPADSVAWLSILRAPYCGLSLVELHSITLLAEGKTVWEAVQESLQRTRPNEAPRLLRCAKAITVALQQKGRKPLRRLVEGCWLDLGGPLCTDAAGIEAANEFFETLEQCDDGGDFTDFVAIHERVAALYAPPDPEVGRHLQMMTIHKAKGLQFDTVILPRLDASTRDKHSALLLWSQIAGERGTGFLLAPVAERGASADRIYQFVLRCIRDKDMFEQVRVLYVAATRAKSRLLLTATLKEKQHGEEVRLAKPHAASFLKLLEFMIDEHTVIRTDSGTVISTDSIQNSRDVSVRRLRRLPEQWLAPAWPERVRHADEKQHAVMTHPDELRLPPFQAGERVRMLGVLVHRVLARIARMGLSVWENKPGEEKLAMIMYEYRRHQPVSPTVELPREALDVIMRMCHDERGRWILREHEGAESEWPLTGLLGGEIVNVVVDRSFIDADGCRWIIDYKLTTHEGADKEEFLNTQAEIYTPQLRRYARIASLLHTRPVRCALYFPVMSEWREIVWK